MTLERLTDTFAFEDVRYRITATSAEKDRGLLVFYLTTGAVQDRLDSCGVAWSEEFVVLPDGKHVECRLTVDGITHADVGEPSEGLGDPMKGAYSDALKRAAVKFGIGRYLRRLGETWAPVEARNGKAYADDKTRKAAERFYHDKVGPGGTSGVRTVAATGVAEASASASGPGAGPAAARGPKFGWTDLYEQAGALGVKPPDVRALFESMGLKRDAMTDDDRRRVLEAVREKRAA